MGPRENTVWESSGERQRGPWGAPLGEVSGRAREGAAAEELLSALSCEPSRQRRLGGSWVSEGAP